MRTFTAVLDRISDGVAVFVSDDVRTFFTAADRLPGGITEGCVVLLGRTDCGVFTILRPLPEETASRRAEAQKVFEKLKDRERIE